MSHEPSLPDEALEHLVWRELDRATRERGHAWRNPVLATVDADQLPQARTVVLRSADQQRGELRVFTDGRSPKVAELQSRPQGMLVFWSPLLNWQLRVSVVVRVLDRGPAVEAAWSRVGASAAASDYLAPAAPGEPWVDDGAARPGGRSEGHHLAILVAQVQAIDWLALNGQGQHRRCRITPQGVERLVP